MTHPFEIPDILCLICEEALPSDLARLLSTSHLFFNCAVPVVWRSLPESAPMILTRLLPNADTYLERNLDATLAEVQSTINRRSITRTIQPLGGGPYAPYVKQLARHRRNRQSNIIWDRLLRLVDRRPILPNLEVLKFSLGIPSSFTVQDPASYLSAYLSPTLVEIDHARNTRLPVGPKSLSDFALSLAQQCPYIHTLKLSDVTRFSIMDPVESALLADSLSRFHNLRILGLGPVALDPKVLTAISSLPSLEELILDEAPDIWELPGLETNYSHLHGGFSTLRRLGISSRFRLPATPTWGIVPLVQRLTSISVRVHSNVTQLELCAFVRDICQCSPLITSLSLDCTSSTNYVALLAPDLIETLGRLALQRLRLQGEQYYGSSSHWNIERFALAFPGLDYLRLYSYYFTFEDLTFIAKHMPKLQQLSMGVKIFTVWPSTEEVSLLAPAPSPSRLHFHLRIFDGSDGWDVKEVFDELPNQKSETIVAYLHALWPGGVICEAYHRPRKGGRPGYTDQINAALRKLRELDGHGNQAEAIPPKYIRKRAMPWLEGFSRVFIPTLSQYNSCFPPPS
ncbi:unnamed protein product [Rhizoctonia solani]|uniref:F-box domain-containing protein n=1 Tax=Rhizoctonia solani TaxID=456999 RepID=A0A8H3HAH5_9AGAM|nr:unnamed protein product [Rhizoctonia solani]